MHYMKSYVNATHPCDNFINVFLGRQPGGRCPAKASKASKASNAMCRPGEPDRVTRFSGGIWSHTFGGKRSTHCVLFFVFPCNVLLFLVLAPKELDKNRLSCFGPHFVISPKRAVGVLTVC